MTRTLLAYINDAHVGTLSAEENIWRFEYTQAWAAAEIGYDLSPALPRANAEGLANTFIDGSSNRPVQWYFENLLPEEALRTVLAAQAEVDAGDAFGLLSYYGSESAGSLTLLREAEQPKPAGLRELPLAELSARIKAMPKVALNNGAPKHMSLAGAQHKLAVIYRDGVLYEPDGPTASSHILKPQHPDKQVFPASVVNEYFTMRVAHAVGLAVPEVQRLFCPEPVYLIKRFDRVANEDGSTARLHVIDACQLLNKDRVFKYSAASVETLASLINYLQVPAAGRQWLYDWLVFNILLGNGDNHLKNISFMVSPSGIVIAPSYDLLSTAAYDTGRIAGDFAQWPQTQLALGLNSEVKYFSQITREVVIAAGNTLGLASATAQRRLDKLLTALPRAVDEVSAAIKQENAAQTEAVQLGLEQDALMLGIIKHIIVDTMCAQLQG